MGSCGAAGGSLVGSWELLEGSSRGSAKAKGLEERRGEGRGGEGRGGEGRGGMEEGREEEEGIEGEGEGERERGG